MLVSGHDCVKPLKTLNLSDSLTQTFALTLKSSLSFTSLQTGSLQLVGFEQSRAQPQQGPAPLNLKIVFCRDTTFHHNSWISSLYGGDV